MHSIKSFVYSSFIDLHQKSPHKKRSAYTLQYLSSADALNSLKIYSSLQITVFSHSFRWSQRNIMLYIENVYE